jgi:hypothetical protein
MSSFPEDFLVSCCHGEGPALTIDAPEAAAWGIEPGMALLFTLNFRGEGHWSFPLWWRANQEEACYLTEEGVRCLKPNGNRRWVVAG